MVKLREGALVSIFHAVWDGSLTSVPTLLLWLADHMQHAYAMSGFCRDTMIRMGQ